MVKSDFEKQYNVKLISKSESKLMRLTGWVFQKTKISPDFMTRFWTTYRIPFYKPVIAYPVLTPDPMTYPGVLEHELVHVEQMRSAWGLFKCALFVSIFPLPVLFSGRWLIERKAYLGDIKKGYLTVEQAVDILWNFYGFCCPKPIMKKWFYKHLEK